MDIGDIRSLFTVLAFMSFIVIVFWAWSGRRREEFDKASRMALEDDVSFSSNRFNLD